MNTFRDFNALGKNSVNNLPQLLLLADFDDLLAKIVTKLINHNISEETAHRVNQMGHKVGRSLLKVFEP